MQGVAKYLVGPFPAKNKGYRLIIPKPYVQVVEDLPDSYKFWPPLYTLPPWITLEVSKEAAIDWNWS